ncbi:exodeoxyribonuclease III [Larsenimonas rhizosphaerae]|uniref:Exodeoxyribonuclease III n=1 Tax=Larsenimonas rhizosphaerae TaxID=2944682 RepID=A0AA41ZF33_9GAMM|nr:exodeoxyribonuclease III [Larsenimonas rhizosphaerae]MCX2523647.1 exodeoxyribonuclease III [Larsenimonas rhizosphaerae]
MRVVSFNINGVRARPHQLEHLKNTLDPDVIGLQETKVQDSEFPREHIEALGYHVYYFGQKGHYGVALLTREPALEVHYGFPDTIKPDIGAHESDDQRRMIGVTLSAKDGPVTIWNGYFPQGESLDHPKKFPHKRRYYSQLFALLEHYHQPNDRVIVMGDYNISPQDLDIGIGEANRKRWLREGKTSFQPEERAWMDRLYALGLSDSYRLCHPHSTDYFSWFDYRSKGFDRDPKRGLRIDLIMVSEALKTRVTASGIDYAGRALEKPSDHAPVWTDLTL